MMNVSDENGVRTLHLEGDLGPRDASDLRVALLDNIRLHRVLVLETGNLASLDVSVMQLLVAALRSAQRLGHELSITSEPRGVLHAALAKAGLTLQAGVIARG